MNSNPVRRCIVCGELSGQDRCLEHRAKWQRRFFYPCKYCGGHVKSYKAKRCRRPGCLKRAMEEAAFRRFGPKKQIRKQVLYSMDGVSKTATAWARQLGKAPSLVRYHLKRGKTLPEIFALFQKGGRRAR